MFRIPRNARVIAVAIAAMVSTASHAAGEKTTSPKAMGASAEVQIGLCGAADHIVRALDLRPRGAPITVWQFDDDALTLLQRGLRLRLRVAVDGSSEYTLKVADQDCARLAPGRVPPGEGKCEYDVYGENAAGAVSITRPLSAKDTGELLAGRSAPAQALNRAQAQYLRKVVRLWPLPAGVGKLGPIEVQRYRTRGDIYDVDISRLPDDQRYAEISRKVPIADATRAMGVLKDDLLKAGVAVCGDQSSPAGSKLRALVR